MSWSVNFIGNPQKIIDALNAESDKLSGQSKEEFDAALPHIRSLLAENFGTVPPVIKLAASGSGYSQGGTQVQRQCTVHIENLYGVLV